MLLVTLIAITFAVALAALGAWRYGIRKPTSSALAFGTVAFSTVVFSVFAAYAFYVLIGAATNGTIPCRSTRCGSSDAHLAFGPARFWLLYGFYWIIGLLCSFLAMLSATLAANRRGGAP